MHPWKLPAEAYTDPVAWNARLDAATSAANEAGPEALLKVLAGLGELECENGDESAGAALWRQGSVERDTRVVTIPVLVGVPVPAHLLGRNL
jgi:hypothetical protein